MNARPNRRPSRELPGVNFPKAGRSPQRRASMGVAKAMLTFASAAEAVLALFGYVLHHFREKKTEVQLDVDELNPSALADKVVNVLKSCPELEELPNNYEGRKSALALLRELKNGRPTRLHRTLQTFVQEQTEAAAHRLRESAEQLVALDIYHADETTRDVTLLLKSISYPEPRYDEFKRATHLFSGLQYLEQDTSLPGAKRDLFTEALMQRSGGVLDDLQKVVAAQIANRAVRDAVLALEPILDEIRQEAATARQRLSQLQTHLKSRPTSQADGLHDTRSSIHLVLPSRSKEDHLVAAKRRLGVNDSAALAAALLETFTAELRELASTEHPYLDPQCSFHRLIGNLPAEAAADVFDGTARQAFSEEYSTYVAVKEYGTERLAEELVQRAEPLVNLNGRERTQLLVEPADITLVITPPPANDDELQVQRQFHRACQRQSTGTRNIPAPPGVTDITVCRLKVGFPAAILADNRDLLRIYGASAEISHLPHLFGVLPESPHGDPRPDLVSVLAPTRKINRK